MKEREKILTLYVCAVILQINIKSEEYSYGREFSSKVFATTSKFSVIFFIREMQERKRAKGMAQARNSFSQKFLGVSKKKNDEEKCYA